jgi:hypothetical protein
MKLVNWGFQDHKIRLRLNTPLFVVKQRIIDRHGRVSSVSLFRSLEDPADTLEGDLKTLEELGIAGAAEGHDPVVCTVYYDFVPYNHADPLLLVEKQGLRPAVAPGSRPMPHRPHDNATQLPSPTAAAPERTSSRKAAPVVVMRDGSQQAIESIQGDRNATDG